MSVIKELYTMYQATCSNCGFIEQIKITTKDKESGDAQYTPEQVFKRHGWFISDLYPYCNALCNECK